MASVWKYVKRIALGLAVIILLLLIWGVGIEPRLVDYKEEVAVIPNLPPAWEGKRVALIADFQVGMWLGNEDTVKKIVNRIIAERPAAVFVAGDFVYKPTDEDEPEDVELEDVRNFMPEVNEAVALLSPLVQANIPTYAVLGNHDYGMGYPDSVKNERLAIAVRQTLESSGVHIVDNAVAALSPPVENNAPNNSTANAETLNPNAEIQTLYVVGIGSSYPRNAKPEIALAQVPDGAARIIFMHEPDSFAAFPANAAPLALAGHTHGGQIRIPFTDDWSWMSLFVNEKVHADGWISDFGQAGNRLYVNRGIGFSSFPIRINCRPELTIFTLRGENG
ncbi:MAG TPA: metallophosphoesterase [Pyrinomonadaceae bacterium]|nr:metallophosphoesterase [Pyrinomonadaceae bacterium]